MTIRNTTALDTARLEALIRPYESVWNCGQLTVLIRNSRGADFSGTCFYAKRRIHVNLGPNVRYPYRMSTYVARARSTRRSWWKEDVRIELADGYQLVLFVFCHELYHWLVKKAGRNRRQKESMCDRFAARELVGRFGCPLADSRGRPVPRDRWDFQDVESFVAAARLKHPPPSAPKSAARAARTAISFGPQPWLFGSDTARSTLHGC
jgi:hypothetical protein